MIGSLVAANGTSSLVPPCSPDFAFHSVHHCFPEHAVYVPLVAGASTACGEMSSLKLASCDPSDRSSPGSARGRTAPEAPPPLTSSPFFTRKRRRNNRAPKAASGSANCRALCRICFGGTADVRAIVKVLSQSGGGASGAVRPRAEPEDEAQRAILFDELQTGRQ
jgi:hypothetical protein